MNNHFQLIGFLMLKFSYDYHNHNHSCFIQILFVSQSFQIQIITRVMKQPYSLNIVDEGRLDLDNLVSVPPGCEKLKIAGIISLSLKVQYISKLNSNLLFKTRLWGRQKDDLLFSRIDEKQAVLNLTIRSSLENASKYFNDMGVICIECYISGKEDQKQPLKSIEYTHFGRIYISIKRYVVSFTLCDFQETCAILDQRKNKIGEVICKLTIDLAKKNNFYPVATQPQIRHDRFQSANFSDRPSHDHSPSHLVRMPQRKDSIQNNEFTDRKEEINHRKSLVQYEGKRKTIVKNAQRLDQQQDFNWKNDRRKGKAVLFLQEYNKNKPQHSELSMIRQKYGFNCPSVEVMKLKLDQAILLSHLQKSAFKDGSRMNLLLKSIKNYSKGFFDSLVILYQQSQQAPKTETKIVLNQQVNGKIQINYLYILQEIRGDETIKFQIKDAKIQLKTGELKDKNSIGLKGRNGKKIATLQFALIQEQFLPAQNRIPVKQQREKEQTQTKKQLIPPNIKQNCFLKVQGWNKGQVILRNKKIGVVNGPKIIYQMQDEEESCVQVELFSAKNRNYIKANINHLLKQQNLIVDGRQVKIITAKGDLPDLLTLVSKIDSDRKKSQISQKSQESALDMKDLVNIFENLEKCQNEQCNQLIHSLSKEFNTKKLEKLSKLIAVNNQIFQNIINLVFYSSFHKFSQAFLTYHNWNHRYISSQRKVQKIIQGTLYSKDLLKAVKRLKRSSDVVFGIVPSSTFLNQFVRHGERAMTQQTQSQFNREELGKLIVLLMERYSSKCIKISELESFLSQSHIYFNLNSYLLCKMVQQIIYDQQSFDAHLNDTEWNLIQVLKTQCDGQWGLAKLLLTNQDQMADSSTITNSQPERRETEPIPEIQQPNHIKTERSKETHKKHHLEEDIHIRVQTQKQPKQSIAIIISDLIVPDIHSVQQIEIFSEHQGLKLQMQQLIFPRAVELIKDSNNTVIVNTLNETYEGVFIANVRPQKVKLFNNGQQVGVLIIFSKLKQQNADDEQIVVRIQDTETIRVPHREELSKEQQQQAQITCITPVAKSSFVKLIIRSIRPTRSNYKLIISSDTQRKALNFPNQNEMILKNSNKGWKIALLDQQVEKITVTNHISSNPYCFLDMRDQRVMFTAVIQVEQCWDPQLSLGLKQSLHLIIHFDQLLSVKGIKQGQYSLICDSEPKLNPIRFEICSQSSKISIYQSVVTQLPPERVTIKLLKDSSKQELAEFRFSLKLIDAGAARNSRYLISNVKGYRLKMTIFQIRHSWQYCKPDRVISLFNSQNRRIIQSWIRSISDLTQEKLISWIKANFQLALSQITILLEQLLHKVSQNSVQTFLETFKRQERVVLDDLDQIMEQFSVFDYNDEGIINDEQLRIAKKVFNRSFKTFFALLLDNQNTFIPSAQVPNNFIIDLSAAIKSNCFDYLSFLDLIEPKNLSNAFDNKKKQINQQFEKKQQQKGQYLSVKITQFQNLSINRLPCTFLFKINDRVLAQPIHKCYSFKYTCSNEIIVPSKPNPQLHILLQSLKPNGTWEQKLLQTLPISDQVKVFGGFIKFILSSTNNSKPQKNIKKQQVSNQNHDSNGYENREEYKYPSPKKIVQEDLSFNQSKNKQFSKSFWNKSLNETRQKWSKWKQSKKTQEQLKRPLKFLQNKSSGQDQY